MGAFDDLIPASQGAVAASGPFDDLVPPKPTGIGYIAHQFAGGVKSDIPTLVGKAAQYLSSPGNTLYEAGTAARQYGEQQAPAYAPDEDHNVVTQALGGAARLAPSMLPLIAAGAAVPEAAPAWIGPAIGAIGAVPFAASAGQETLEKARQVQGVSEDDALAAARENALAQGAIMTAGGSILGKIAGGASGPIAKGIASMTGKEAAPAAKALGEFSAPKILKPLAASIPEAAATNVALFGGQAAATAAIEKAHGISDQSPWDAAVEQLPTALALAPLMAPLSAIGFARNAMARGRIAKSLADTTMPDADRGKAVEQVFGRLKDADPTAADQWAQNAATAISQKKPIGLTPDWLTATPDSLKPPEPTGVETGTEEAPPAATAEQAPAALEPPPAAPTAEQPAQAPEPPPQPPEATAPPEAPAVPETAVDPVNEAKAQNLEQAAVDAGVPDGINTTIAAAATRMGLPDELAARNAPEPETPPAVTEAQDSADDIAKRNRKEAIKASDDALRFDKDNPPDGGFIAKVPDNIDTLQEIADETKTQADALRQSDAPRTALLDAEVANFKKRQDDLRATLPEGDENALPKSQTGSVLQREPSATGEAGGEHGRVEQGVEGTAPAQEIEAKKPEETSNSNVVTPVDYQKQATDLVAAHPDEETGQKWKHVQEAADFLIDDRSHGDEWMADASKQVYDERGGEQYGGTRDVQDYVAESMRRADALRAAEENQPYGGIIEAKAQATDEAANKAATSTQNELPEPTRDQALAGNYQKGHIDIGGLDISIENPQGSTRSDKENVPPKWSNEIKDAHYGYIRGTVGNDGDHIDTFVKPGTPDDYAGQVFVVDQRDKSGKFDEHKAMIGYGSQDEAVAAYKANYPSDFKVGPVTETTMDGFKDWTKNGDTKKPFGETKPAQEEARPAVAETKAPVAETPVQKAETTTADPLGWEAATAADRKAIAVKAGIGDALAEKVAAKGWGELPGQTRDILTRGASEPAAKPVAEKAERPKVYPQWAHTLDLRDGDTVTLSKRIDYAGEGEPYRIDIDAGKGGELWVQDMSTGGRTSLRPSQVAQAIKDGTMTVDRAHRADTLGWDGATKARRESLMAKAGFALKDGSVSAVGKKIAAQQKWADMTAGTRDAIKTANPAAIPKRPPEQQHLGQQNNVQLKRLFHQSGVDIAEQSDISGERGAGARRGGQMPGTFRNNGMKLDDWGEKLVQQGWLEPESQSERGNENIRASMQDVREFMRRVFDGEPVWKLDQMDERAKWAEEQGDRLHGLLRPEELLDLADESHSAAENAMEFDAAKVLEASGIHEADLDSIVEAASIKGGDDAKAYEQAIHDEIEKVRQRDAESGKGAPVKEKRPSLELASETNEQVLAREKATADAEAKTKADKATADSKERDERVKAEVKQRSEAAAGTFELGQKAEDNLSGQRDLLTGAKPEAKDQTKPAPANTEDAGAELAYNRRNRIRGGITWSDIADKNPTLQVKETNKQNVYPKPDYEALVKEVQHPTIAHIVKQIYDAIAAKPQTRAAPTAEDMQRYIAGVHRVMDGVMKWARDADQTKAFLGGIGERAGKLLGASRGEPTSVTSMIDRGGRPLVDAIYHDGWKARADEIRAIGGNKFFRALQPGTDEVIRGMKAVEEGWPASQEAWQKRFFLDEKDGKFHVMMKAAKWRHAAGDPPDGFASKAAAEDFARSLTKRENRPTISDKGISVASAKREGPERRMEGEDVSSDKLKETFGFKGVNFGNWMKGEGNTAERQLHLNHAYDSMHDLAELLNVPPKAVSLDGMLGVAVGAQGSGHYAAHFVPGLNEINLTRTSGAGSLAHEWAHALDHYFATQAGLATRSEPFLTEHVGPGRTLSGVRPEIANAFRAIVQAMNRRHETPEQVDARMIASKAATDKRVTGWLASIKRDFVAAKVDPEKFDAIADDIKNLNLGDGKIAAGKLSLDPKVEELRQLYKDATGRTYSLDNIKGLQANVDHAAYMASEEAAERSRVPQETGTQYAKDAAELDAGKGGKQYWSTNLEKFARAFDAYISDKLEATARKNTYLSHAGRDNETVPRGAERAAIDKAFDTLVGEIKTKETEKGTALYDRGGDLSFDATGMHAKDVQRVYDQLTARFKGRPEAVIAPVKDWPFSADSARIEQAITVGGKVRGAYWKGKVYLDPEAIATKDAALFVVKHELAHSGLAAILKPASLKTLMERIYDTNDKVKALADVKMKKLGYDKALAAEEAIADMAGRGEWRTVKGWPALFAQIRMALRKFWPSMKFSDDDVAALISRSQRAIENGAQTKVVRSNIAQPNSVRESGDDFFGRWKPPKSTFDAAVNSMVIPALQHDQVVRAVVDALPVDMVNMLAKNGVRPEQLVRDPAVFLAKLPVNARLPVANRLGDALVVTGTRLRTRLDLAEKTGRDLEVLPALRASSIDLDIASRIRSAPLGVDGAGGVYQDVSGRASAASHRAIASILAPPLETEERSAVQARNEGARVGATGVVAGGATEIAGRPLLARELYSAMGTIAGNHGVTPESSVMSEAGRAQTRSASPIIRHDETLEKQIPPFGGLNQWFGKSKIMDTTGEPLAVRGTGTDMHFAAEGKGGPSYLAIKNPKRVPDQDRANNGDWTAAIARAKAEGRDGLVYRKADGKDAYVAFREDQVRAVPEAGPKLNVQDEDDAPEAAGRGPGGAPLYSGVERPEMPKRPILGALQKIFAPASRGPIAYLQAGIMRHNFAKLARESEVANEDMKQYAKAFSKMPIAAAVRFIDAYERGGVNGVDPVLRPIAAQMKAFNDDLAKRVQDLGTGKLQELNDTYLGRIWRNSDAKVASVFGRRQLEGGKGFLKQRTYEYFSDGLAAGLEPITNNPVEMMLLKGQEVRRYIYGQTIFQEMKDAGLAKFVKFGAEAPEGWTKINDKIAQVRQYSEAEKGFIERGSYYAPDEAATLVNNHLSPGLQGNGAYDAFRKAGNMMNSAQLGLSLFHVGFTTIDSMVSRAALGVQQLSRGDFLKGIGSIAQGVNPVQPFLNVYKGDRLLRAYLGKLEDPSLAPIIEALVAGGGRAKLDAFYRNAALGSFKQAIERNDKLGAAKAFLPTVMDKINAPVFEQLVPRQKLGVFFDLAKDWLERNPNATVEQKREAMGKAWDSVDNRMGQLAYDNVFWHRALKDSLMIGVRSVGWNLGTFRELGGGVYDIKSILKNKELSTRTAYAIALPFVAAVMGATLGYLYTGKPPDELEDYFFPKTGKMRPDRTQDRISLPTYVKDVYAYGHDITNFLKYGTDPTNTLQNKLHPLLGVISQMISNKDFFGGAIRSPGDSVVRQLQDEAEYLAAQITPFGIRNYEQQAKLDKQEMSIAGYLTNPSMIGVTPAAGYITKSPRQTEAAALGAQKDSLKTKFREFLQNGGNPGDATRRMLAAGLRMPEIHEIMREGLSPVRTSKLPPRRLIPQLGS